MVRREQKTRPKYRLSLIAHREVDLEPPARESGIISKSMSTRH